MTGKVVAAFSMSLDGFIAASDDTVPHIFDWYDNGEVRFEWPGNDIYAVRKYPPRRYQTK